MQEVSQLERGRALNTLTFYVHEIGYTCRYEEGQLELVQPDGLPLAGISCEPHVAGKLHGCGLLKS
jgi:hypothetical protein